MARVSIILRSLLGIGAAIVLAGSVAGCDDADSPGDAVDEAGDAVEDAADEAGDAAEDAADEIDDSTEQ